jgi:hypothetical protein
MSQSTSGGRFMWLSHGDGRCISFDSGYEHQVLAAEHDGYLRLPDPVTHRREWSYEPRRKCLTVTDRLSAKGAHDFVWHWHFAETVAVDLEAGRITARVPGWRIEMTLPAECETPRCFRGSEQPIAGWISRRFEQKTPTTTVCWRAHSSAAAKWETLIHMIREATNA